MPLSDKFRSSFARLTGQSFYADDHSDASNSQLAYSWGDLEPEEDFAADLTPCTSGATEVGEIPDPFRNPESPLDEWDFEQFEARTAHLASCNASPTIAPMENPYEVEEWDSQNDRPPPIMSLSNQQELFATIERLERKMGCIEATMEARYNALEQDLMQECNKISDGIGNVAKLLNTVLHQMPTHNLTTGVDAHPAPEHEVPAFNRAVGTNPRDLTASSRPIQAKLSSTEQYIHSWHAGSLVLIENISEATPIRDIHALFQNFGRITYIELHAADKSRPHIAARHAYLHYADVNSAHEARRFLHGFALDKRCLMVFPIPTNVPRGEPGKPYIGPALEVLNFNGGPNFASPEADCFQYDNEGLRQLNGETPIMNPKQQAAVLSADCFQGHENEQQLKFSGRIASENTAKQLATYSLQPNLTHKTAAPSWRRNDGLTTADASTEGLHGKFASSEDLGKEAIVFQGRGLQKYPTPLNGINEFDGEDGGVYLPFEYEDEDRDLFLGHPVQPREFV